MLTLANTSRQEPELAYAAARLVLTARVLNTAKNMVCHIRKSYTTSMPYTTPLALPFLDQHRTAQLQKLMCAQRLTWG